MADNDIAVGDTVELKSGGPVMTVTEISGEDVYVTWFNEKQEQNSSFFNRATLKKVDPDSYF